MKTRWTSLVVAGTIGLMLSGQVLAQPRGGGPSRGRGFGRGQGMGFGVGMMAERPGPMGRGMGPGGDGVCPLGLEPGTGRTLGCPLGPGLGFGGGLGLLELTDEQRALIADIYELARQEAQEIQAALLDARNELHTAVASADMDKIDDAARLLANAIASRAVLHARTMSNVRTVLTDAQVQELEQLRLAAPQFRGGMRGRGMGPGFGARRWAPEQ